MKRAFSLLSLLLTLLITSCDDGDIEVKNIDFSSVTIQKCSEKDIYYKIKDSELLTLEMPSSNLPTDETLEGTPREIELSSAIKLTYRQYASTVTAANLCPIFPDVDVNLLEQWVATTGTIQIVTTAVKNTNAETGATRITAYKHAITFKNITFQKPNGDQIYPDYTFGSYNTSVSQLAFNFDEEVQKSTCDNRIFNFSGGESLILNVADFSSLFANEVTTTPRVALLNTTNTLKYRLYNGSVNNAYFCASPVPLTPSLLQEWVGENGVADVSGIIEVTTVAYGAGFQHTIHLKNVTMRKQNSTFLLATDYLYGSFITN
jgi:hypothetical protein